MLRAVDIRTTAAREGTDAGIIEKDYILTKTLSVLAGDAAFANKLVFRGGTALKKCYFPDWRFSEDLDFTSTTAIKPAVVKGMFAEVARGVTEIFGVSMRVIEYSQYPRQGEDIVSAQLKLGYDGPLHKTSGQKNNIKIDLAFDEQIIQVPLRLPVIPAYTDDAPSVLAVYTLTEMLAEKARSLLQRGKSRDFYDVWRLLKKNPQPFDSAAMWSIFLQKIESKGIATPHSLNDFLPDSRVSAASQFWRRVVAHQVRTLPDFSMVLSELREVMAQLFGPYLE